MAYIKALFLLAVVAAVAMAAEEPVREKKAILYGAHHVADDGQWAPGKYEGLTYSHAIPLAAAPWAGAPYAAYHHPAAYRSVVW